MNFTILMNYKYNQWFENLEIIDSLKMNIFTQ